MPTLSFKTRIRSTSESASLNLNVRHNIVAGQPSDLVHTVKPSLLASLDIVLPSNLLITISGRLNGSCIPPAVLLKSQITCHLVHYFKTNAENLCINAVSGPSILDNTGLATSNPGIQLVNVTKISKQSFLVTLSCSRPLSEPRLPISIALDGIHLFYDWQTNSASTMDDSLNPFSSSLPLPYLTLVEDVAQRFTASQLVKRYPIIFGNWSKQLHLEKKIALSIWGSIQNIIENSPNEDFKNSFRQIIGRMRSRMVTSLTESVSRLSEHLENAGEETTWTAISMGDDKDAFGYYMHHLYTRNMRRPMFKSQNSGGLRLTNEGTNLELLELDFPLSPAIEEDTYKPYDDDIDLFDDDEMLCDPEVTSLRMNGSRTLETGSSQTTCCVPEEMDLSAALHANWSQDTRLSQKHLTWPIMGMGLDTIEDGTSSSNGSHSLSCATPAELWDVEDPVGLPLVADLSSSDDTIATLDAQYEGRTEDCDTWPREDRIAGNIHDAGNVDLFDLIQQHESEIGTIPWDMRGHGTNSMAGHPSSEEPTLSCFDGPQNHSHASQSYQDVDNAPHLWEVSHPSRCQSQALDLEFSVVEF